MQNREDCTHQCDTCKSPCAFAREEGEQNAPWWVWAAASVGCLVGGFLIKLLLDWAMH